MTYIEKIVVEGFKSYGKERLEIPLGKGFVAVVGPNGAGKSNIGDAISFALGITTTKNLRAKNLSYLIFSRNGERAEHAYVEIHLKNENSFPIEEEDIVISRKVLRDGRSIFKVNGVNVREKDLKRLLAKANIYEDGYNVVMQGTITQLTGMSPLGRRRIIEDIAGISEYEEKKRKALEDLGEIEAKISELKLLIEEINVQLERLKGDMEKARRYKEVAERKREVEIKIHLKKAWNARRDFENLKAKLEEIGVIVSDIGKRISEKERLLAEKEERLSEINSNLLPYMERQGKITSDIQHIDNIISSKFGEIEKYREDIKKLEERKVSVEKMIEDNERDVEDLRNKIEEEEKKLGELKIILEEKERELHKLNKELQVSLEEARRVEEKERQLMEIINTKRREIKDIEGRMEKLKTRRERVIWEMESIKDNMAKVKGRLGEISLEKERYEKIIETETKNLSSLRKKVEFLESEVGRIRGEIEDILKKKISLESKVVLSQESRIDFNGIEGVYGYAGDLIELVDESFLTAIEVAGGGRLKYIVVESEEVAGRCIEFLKKNRLGRASFIPLNRIKPMPLPPYPRQRGYVDFAVNLVRYEHKFEPAIKFVFGDTLVVENFDVARLIGIGNYRMVTLEGELFEKTGVITGGYYESRGDLGVKVYEEKLQRLAENEELLKKREADVFNQLKSARDELITKESMINVTVKKLEALDKEYANITANVRELEERLKKGEEYLKVIEEEIKGLEEEYRKKREELAYDEEKLNNLRLRREDITSYFASSGIEDVRREVERIRRKFDSKKEEISNLKFKYEQLKSGQQSLLKELENVKMAIEESKRAIRECEEAIKKMREHRRGLEDELKKSQTEVYALYKEKERLEEEIREIQAELGHLKAEEDRKRQEMQTLGMEEAKAEQKLKDLEIKLIELGYAGDIVEVKEGISRLEEEARKLQRELESMGNVNLKAEEDYKEEKARYDEYQEKYKRLLEEKKAIKELIEEVEKKKLKAFMDAFTNINKNLKRIYAFLSPGGRAEMEMENEHDPFAGGINLRVKPRGKDVKYLESMSGGEKTIAALALIFAIQEYKPSPFYYFDEVDAHLDEANARKVGELIRSKSRNTQFIVVTLKEVLASYADRLIGVTARGGVSRVFTVNNLSEIIFEEAKSA